MVNLNHNPGGGTAAVASRAFLSVSEQDEFLALFPHRFDYIYAPHPQPGQKPQWQTESRYPLSDRMALLGDRLYGVRFGKTTQYGLLDIDIHSAYHPRQDPFAVSRIAAALEPLGLVDYLICTSSYSGGLHLYFPLQKAQISWELAIVLATLLENAGFLLSPGQLEVFPNRKAFQEESPSLFNAHRLPMQTGSYLLNRDFEPVWSDRSTFVQQWRLVAAKNELDLRLFRRTLRLARGQSRYVSGRAQKFLQDLDAEIEAGWTGRGQTNRLLGRIALRTYVFHHTIFGGQPLRGQALIDEVVRVARSLPGYGEWCQHQHEMEQRAAEWARCVESSRYFPFGTNQKSVGSLLHAQDREPAQPSWNQRQAAAARQKICLAIADLLEKSTLPAGATARFQALTRYGIGGGSLYRHRDLWHPGYLVDSDLANSDSANPDSVSPKELSASKTQPVDNSANPVEFPLYPPGSFENVAAACAGGTSAVNSSTSLLPSIGGNDLLDLDSQRSSISDSALSGRNELAIDRLQSSELLDSVNQLDQVQLDQIQLDQTDPSQPSAPHSKLKPEIKALIAQGKVMLKQARERFRQQWHRSSSRSVLEDGDDDAPNLPLPAAADLLPLVAFHIQRLGLTPQQESDRLWRRYGKRDRSRLSPAELMQWLRDLELE